MSRVYPRRSPSLSAQFCGWFDRHSSFQMRRNKSQTADSSFSCPSSPRAANLLVSHCPYPFLPGQPAHKQQYIAEVQLRAALDSDLHHTTCVAADSFTFVMFEGL